MTLLFKGLLLALLFILFTVQIALAANLNVSTNFTTQPGKNITIIGSVVNTTTTENVSSIIVNATVNFASTTNQSNQTTGNSGVFNFNLTAPTVAGFYNITIATNRSDISSRILPIYVSNITGGSVVYVNNLPPFSAGTTFTINITMLNGTTSVANYKPDVLVFNINGPTVSGWTITNLTAASNANGVIQYNITIPSDATASQYMIAVDKGIITSVFTVQSGFTLAVNTQTLADEITANFAPSSTVNIMTKLRNSAGDPVTSVSSISAVVTKPDGNTESVSLTAHPTLSGQYNNTFTNTSQRGTYTVAVTAVASGTTLTGSTTFNTKSFNVRLEPQKDFFFEFGGSSAFRANSTVGLSILAVNLTTGDIITVGSGISACDGTTLKFIDVFVASNGTSINSTITNALFSTGAFALNQVCRVSFTGPSQAGIYGVKVNLTIGSETQTAEGFFSIQNYILKVAPIQSAGGHEGFFQFVQAGSNATFEISAFNLSSQDAIASSNILNILALKIVKLTFTGGSTEITNLNQSVDTSGSKPTVVVTIPDTFTGPGIIQVQANISNELVRGNAFFISKIVQGFLAPQFGGGGGGGGFAPFVSCRGSIIFSGIVNDVATNQPLQGVSVNSIIDAREELTGKNVVSFLSMTPATSDSSGRVNVNVTFSSSASSLSGFFFMRFNVTYQGKNDEIFSGFACKTLNFFAQITPVGSTSFSWQVSPTSSVLVSISNVRRANDSAIIPNASNPSLFNASILQLLNFDPSKGGMKVYRFNLSTSTTNGTVVFNATATQNNVSFILSPSNFTDGTNPLTRWPTGFFDARPQVCTTIGCDTSFGGFEVVAFDAWLESFQFGQTFVPGSTFNVTVIARTNISTTLGTNNFTIKVGRPWEGELFSGTLNSATLLNDGWNKSTDFGFERWQVNFTLPSNVKKGEALVLITVNNSQGEQRDINLFGRFARFTVSVPPDEVLANFDAVGIPNSIASQFGWNITHVNVTLNVWSKTPGGVLCSKSRFITLRSGSPITYDSDSAPVQFLVVDNTTAGVYDTVVMNNTTAVSGGRLAAISIKNRNFTAITGNGGIYLNAIEDCPFVRISNVNSDALTSGSTFIGSFQKSKSFFIPYVVTLSNSRQSGVTVSLKGIGKQSMGGFGFEGKLKTPDDFTVISNNTDANGVAFVQVNVTTSGRFISFWKINSTASDEDSADFSSGSMLEVKAFSTEGGQVFDLPSGRVTLLFWNNTGATSIWNNEYTPSEAPIVYNGTITETSAGDFVRDSNVSTFYVIYAPNITNGNRNLTSIASCQFFNTSCQYNTTHVEINSSSFNFNANSTTLRIFVSAIRLNTSAASSNLNNVTIAFYQDSPAPNSFQSVTSAATNVTVKACAKTFGTRGLLPIEGAIVRIQAQRFSGFGPPTLVNMTMYDPITDTDATSTGIRTGPAGCVAFKVSPGSLGSWPTDQTIMLQGTITRPSDNAQENVFAGAVMRTP